MEAVEALYKAEPRCLVYGRIQQALKDKSTEPLYKHMREYEVNHILDNFTKESLKEIQKNLKTTKYPVLLITYYASFYENGILAKPIKNQKEFLKKIANMILDQPLTQKEKSAIAFYTSSRAFLRLYNWFDPFMIYGCKSPSQETIEKYIH